MLPRRSARGTLPLALLLLPAAAGALPPARYLPAPKGLAYFMVYTGGTALGQNASSESAPVSTLDIGVVPPPAHLLKSKWTSQTAEVGLMAGYGLGSFWFLKGNDLSLYVPFDARAFDPPGFWDASATDPNQVTTFTGQTLHESVRAGQSGKGVGDIAAAVQSMFWADSAAGAWGTGAVKVVVPSSAARGDRTLARILHGTFTDPGGGAAVTQIVPAATFIKLVGGQRLYLDLEFAQPIGKDSFSVATQDFVGASPAFSDAGTTFQESFAPHGTILGTIGVETSLNFWGVAPGLEVTVRQYQAAHWAENGRDPLAPATYSETEVAKPNQPPEFLKTAAWSIAGVPLKNNTEIEIGLLASWRVHANDIVKAGVSYISNSFGGYSIGLKVSFTNLLVQKTEEQLEREAYGTVHTREFEAAPVIESPAAPSGRILTGVTFPAFGEGVSQEEADWAAQRLREGVKRLRGYDLFPAADMAQLGLEACGDAECGTRFGRALKLQAMVVSRLEKTAAGFTLTATLVDVAAGTPATSEAIAGAALEELRKQVPGLLDRLTHPAPTPGAPVNP